VSIALALLRDLVFVAFLAASFVAFGSWAVRTRAISPFGFLARMIRRLSDPVIDPIERWQLKRGGNPQNAPWWLLGGVIVGGIVLISGTQWLAAQIERASYAARFGARGLLALAIYYAFRLVIFALVVRVIGSWVGVFRYNRWVRWAYFLTDWIVEPLRRVVPTIGMIDISPLVAWFLLEILERIVMGIL
jgi:YggT family protein